MNSPADDIKDMLVADDDSSSGVSLNLVFATNLFVGKEPAKPPNCVTIKDYPGFAPSLSLGGKQDSGYEYPSIQIRVRNSSEPDGWALIERIKNSLHARNNQVWNGALYTVIYCSSGPALLEYDDNNRAILVINFNLQRREN
jgi:hypothetical protein